MASADVTAELRCSICMEIYRDPVTLPCGHNFCRGCITQAWDHQTHLKEYKCPECQKIYRKRPELVRNTTLHNICEAFHATETDQEQTGVFCNYCDFPVPATKSCLQCETSLCDHHLRKHDRSGGHTLLPPTTDLGKRKCSVHKKILEYYCTEDAACVCVSCYVIGGHVGHKMLSLVEASEEKKKKLRNYLQKLMAEKEKAEKRVQSLEEHRRKAQPKADGEENRENALFRDLRGWQVESYDVNRKLEIKKEELSKKICHIEELCNMTDPLTVLQESHTGDLCDMGDGESDITRRAQYYDDAMKRQEIKKEELSRKMCSIEEECNMPDPLSVLLDVTGDIEAVYEDRYDNLRHYGGDLGVIDDMEEY
ncbi:E3 ubiquitin-protein ligase TRIM8-like [Hyperolius riggenbachi]|uniref:E3 ubiquitin-protein ligase TRIM8-like n=1 Tax=Hyperolius riggenbachi TaxID=752182 RepID=UPI0035A37F41